MLRRFTLLGLLAATAALVWFGPALAGGWAVIILDTWPQHVTAGEPVEVILTVRQHGRTLLEGLTVSVSGYHPASKNSIQVTAQELGQPGRYSASLVFPVAGRWEWSVKAFEMNQNMPELDVLAVNPLARNPSTGIAEESATTAANQALSRPFMLFGMLFLGLGAGTAVFGLLRRRRSAWVIAGVFGALAIFSFVFNNQPGVMAAEAANQAPAKITPTGAKSEQVFDVSTQEMGQRLFIAKGCITCHRHPAFSDNEYFSLDIKDLTGYTAIPEYLRIWLKDPPAIKPKTDMPNLELKENEIEALIAFLVDYGQK